MGFHGFSPCSNSIFNGGKGTDMLASAINLYACDPVPVFLVPSDAKVTARIIPSNSSIFQVLLMSGRAKVFNCIVRAIAIPVIYFMGWHFTRRVKPSETVRIEAGSSNAYLDVAMGGLVACNVANADAIREAGDPSELSGFLVVAKHFSQLLKSNVDHVGPEIG
jgi:hypothetical protein